MTRAQAKKVRRIFRKVWRYTFGRGHHPSGNDLRPVQYHQVLELDEMGQGAAVPTGTGKHGPPRQTHILG